MAASCPRSMSPRARMATCRWLPPTTMERMKNSTFMHRSCRVGKAARKMICVSSCSLTARAVPTISAAAWHELGGNEMTAATAVRFRFGENWQSFIAGLTDVQIEAAVRDLRRLFPNDELAGASFLDIGCGSGLSMLAAIRLGAARVYGIDADAQAAV